MEDDERHSHLIARENSRTRSQAGKDSSPHNTPSQGKDPMHERESSVSEHKEQHPHGRQHHPHPSVQPKTSTASTATTTSSMTPAMTNYNVNVQFDPVTPQAGKPTNLSLIATEQKVGEPIREFDIIHDKLMHLIIVNREDLSHFAHIHPKLNEQTGTFHIAHTFSKAGKYKMWIDVKPKGGMQILTAFPFNVEGQPVHTPANITSDMTFVKEVVTDVQHYQVTLDFQLDNLGVGRNTILTFEIRDANGKPITNLEPLMAAGGHCVIIDAAGHEFLHVHPAEEVDDVANWRGGPCVSFMANFPKPGLYRAWGQFQHEGRLLTADFTFEVVAR
jgi:hypothetical protein